tara:strand:+ start:482 stop:724 length:243 start_codon:yes stop_codon:yes gene_type:complete
MIVNFDKHPWVHQGNINKVKKLIMSSEEFNLARIETLEKEMKRLKDLIKEKEDTLALERQRNREMVTEMEVELDKFREDD